MLIAVCEAPVLEKELKLNCKKASIMARKESVKSSYEVDGSFQLHLYTLPSIMRSEFLVSSQNILRPL